MQILVFISDQEDRRSLLEILREGGHSYIEAEDSENALYLVKTYYKTILCPDIIVFDWGSYGKDRIELVKELKRLGIDIPIISLETENEELISELRQNHKYSLIVKRSEAYENFLRIFAALPD